MPQRVAIATCRILPEPDVDEEILMDALRQAGIRAELAAWDDDSIRWKDFSHCIIRSTWNYPEFPIEFRSWVESVRHILPMLNPAEVILSNIDKRYLLELQAQGISIVPTEYFNCGTKLNLEAWRGREFVVKPTVSAGSWMTRKFSPDEFECGTSFLRGHLSNRDMMVQPYLDSVERGGEVAWIWIDGEVTHGVRKSPRFEEDVESVSQAVEPTSEAKDLVLNVLSKIDADLLYARIDLIESDGKFLLSELELIEPSLFFRQKPYALSRFVESVKRRVA